MSVIDTSLQGEYRNRVPIFTRLADEALFALKSGLDGSDIKLHSLTTRVKSLASLEEKIQRKAYSAPLQQVTDIVGVRIVVLFLSDLSRVAEIVASTFDVLDADDKVQGVEDPSTFGYMSQHFEAMLPKTHTGPRYDDLLGIRFEVQVRTLLMDAWANVSHHLAYKGESSIPPELRRDFHALSGLFYVADKHFELFFDRTRAVREQTGQLLTGTHDEVGLNLDTLAAFLLQRFPDRVHSARPAVGQLADELLRFGYETLPQVEDVLAQTADRFALAESERPPHGEGGGAFFDVGVVRKSLELHDPSYADFLDRTARGNEGNED
jgi:putative GTP pyrophosphokinase